jgi:uncharacterized protein YggU (UPF0235/DUF167 family)
MIIKVFVTPSAKRESVEAKTFAKTKVRSTEPEARYREKEEVLLISVKEPAERNLANTRVREIIAARLGVLLGKVRIFTGHHSRSKIVSISD